MSDWIAPAVVVAVVLAAVRLWYTSRQSKLKTDREVLDQLLVDADEFFEKMARLEALVVTSAGSSSVTVAAISDAASTLLEAWAALERAAWRVGRLSRLRYDGLRALGGRIHDACTSTAGTRAFLEVLATGTAYTDATKLSEAIPWPDLRTDALVFRTLAVVYRRRGPLTLRRRVWWRRRGKRESTYHQIAAPLRRRKRKSDSGDRVTSVEQAAALIRELPEFHDLNDAEVNAVAYRVLYSDEADDFGTPEEESRAR